MLTSAQKSDPFLAKCFAAAGLGPNEFIKKQFFLVDNDVLMRKWVAQSGKAAVD